MLDEPTNHLDTDAKSWLMGFLASYRGALLVISHDLGLLDEAITRVLHLNDSRLTEYRGTYSQYRRALEADQVRQAKVAAAQAGEIKRLSTLADSMRGQTQRRARTAKSIDHRVERLRNVAVTGPVQERTMALRLPEPPRAGRVVLEVEGLAKHYGGPPIFSDVSFDLGRGERLMVMGLNGAGKTSLLRILAGENQANAGTWRFGLDVSTGYYAQEHEGVVAGKDVLSHMREQADLPVGELRALLGMFGLPGEMAFQGAGTLSGGEKTKLALSQLTAGRHNLLLLDEPTNNLDPPSRTSVAAALAGWGGAMVLVSHDPEFVRGAGPPAGAAHARGDPRPLERRLPRPRGHGVAVPAGRDAGRTRAQPRRRDTGAVVSASRTESPTGASATTSTGMTPAHTGSSRSASSSTGPPPRTLAEASTIGTRTTRVS